MLPKSLQQHTPDQAITSDGVARRLQALAALGWSRADLAARLDIHSPGPLRRLFAGTGRPDLYERVAELYERLADVTPPDTADARSARGDAAYRGWSTPAAWRGRLIDDPAAQPDHQAVQQPQLAAEPRTGHSEPRRAQRLARRQWGGGVDLVEDLEWMLGTGETMFGACRRLGVAPGALYVALRRLERLDVWARLTPWADAA